MLITIIKKVFLPWDLITAFRNKMKKGIAKYFIIATLIIFSIVSCAKKQKIKQHFTFKIGAIASGLPINGGSFVRAISSSTNALVKLDANDSAVFEFGNWEFQVVSFEGPSAFMGKRYCGRKTNFNLDATPLNAALTLNEANCLSEPFISLIAEINNTYASNSFLTVKNTTLNVGALGGGTFVTITGTGFATGATVEFDGQVCSGPTVISPTAITCTTPAHAAGPANVKVTNIDSQSASASNAYTYMVAPSVTSVSLNAGPLAGGTAVTITGTGFVTGITATFGDVACTTPTFVNSTSMTCITPAYAAGAVTVAVTNTDTQIGSTAAAYTYRVAPTVTSVGFNTGSLVGGTVVTITGSNFISGATVDFGGLACTSVTFVNPTSLTCITPAHATGAVTVTVTNPDTQSGGAAGAYNYKQSFISTWRTTALNESVTLPLIAGFTYNFTVDWGDGSGIGIVTSNIDTDKNHTYASAGDYTVTLNGTAQAWAFINGGSALKIIAVVNFGDLGWTNLNGAFWMCNNLITFAGGNTAAVTDMSSMFFLASALTTLDLSSFNTAAVTNMSSMFYGASALTTLDLSSFNTAAVTNMSDMFYGASALTTLDLSSFTTAAVTDMSYMFYGASALTTLDLSSFNTAAVINMSYMFAGASALTTLDLSSFNTAAVINMYAMFLNASSLTTLDLSSFNTAAVTNMSGMFYLASALTTLNTTGWNLALASASTNVFTSANAGPVVTCNQGGTPASGTFFGKICN